MSDERVDKCTLCDDDALYVCEKCNKPMCWEHINDSCICESCDPSRGYNPDNEDKDPEHGFCHQCSEPINGTYVVACNDNIVCSEECKEAYEADL